MKYLIRAIVVAIVVTVVGLGVEVKYGGIDPVMVMCLSPDTSSRFISVPDGAIWNQETSIAEADTRDYGAMVAWINAATALPCLTDSSGARIEIRSLRIIERAADGQESVIRSISFPGNADIPADFRGALFPRLPVWFGETKGVPDTNDISNVGENGFVIDLSRASQQIYHAWTDPRTSIVSGARYFIEAEVRISGAARLQFGVDYWRDLSVDYNGTYDKTCRASNNCEVWISDWFGDTSGQFVTIRVPSAS